MTDKPKDKKIVGIRKDVVIEDKEDKLPDPIPSLVELTKTLHEDALSGHLRELVYSACDTSDTPRFGVVGTPHNFTLMATVLGAVKTMYEDMVVFPFLLGVEEEDFDDE